ncbi:transposase [Vibrio sp. 10N.286.49.F3]
MKTEARNWSSDQWYLKCWNTFALSMHAVISAKNRIPQPHRSKASTKKLSADAHQLIRDELYEWMINLQVTGSNPLGKAIEYKLGQWPKLIRYIDDGHLSIDNNRAERENKPLVIGRIN